MMKTMTNTNANVSCLFALISGTHLPIELVEKVCQAFNKTGTRSITHQREHFQTARGLLKDVESITLTRTQDPMKYRIYSNTATQLQFTTHTKFGGLWVFVMQMKTRKVNHKPFSKCAGKGWNADVYNVCKVYSSWDEEGRIESERMVYLNGVPLRKIEGGMGNGMGGVSGGWNRMCYDRDERYFINLHRCTTARPHPALPFDPRYNTDIPWGGGRVYNTDDWDVREE